MDQVAARRGRPAGAGGSAVAGTGGGSGTGSLAGTGGAVVTGAAGTGGGPVVVECNGIAPGRAPLRRLTTYEYNNTIRDLLGDTTTFGDSRVDSAALRTPSLT
jgi:hypothetical protein